MSKPVAAMGTLRLVEEGRLTLDDDVNEKLRSWKAPGNDLTARRPVTLRGIPTHSAGLTVHGFPGYAADAPIPPVVQVLNGEKPANTAAVRVDVEPGSQWRQYTGRYVMRGSPFALAVSVDTGRLTLLTVFYGQANAQLDEPGRDCRGTGRVQVARVFSRG